jgi:hypothetical protein
MSKVVKRGRDGQDGTLDNPIGQQGGLAVARNLAGDNAVETARAIGGAGGDGARGGSGGRGGTAIAETRLDATGVELIGQAFAIGGTGGDNRGDGNGGDGGWVRSATVAAYNQGGGIAQAGAFGRGGAGGVGSGAGNSGGDGGVVQSVSSFAVSYGGTIALAKTIAQGGDGGNGIKRADGGQGADAQLVDATISYTVGGNAIHDQQAFGGKGGNSAGGQAGDGGDAVNRLTVDDIAVPLRSARVDTFMLALGGNGGNATGAGIAGDGGSGYAALSLRAVTQSFLVQAAGGNGGEGANGGGRGGDASFDVSGDALQRVAVNGEAFGGDGGDATVTGNGGDGGRVLASTAYGVGGQSLNGVSADAFGGHGGDGRGAGFSGGAGADVGAGLRSEIVAVAAAGVFINSGAYLRGTGGNGGAGFEGADGGSGGDVVLANQVFGTSNGSLQLDQVAIAGQGGAATGGGNGGAGGHAEAVLERDYSAVTAGSLDAVSASYGGTGGAAQGNGALAGAAGDAVATMILNGGVSTAARSFAVGGFGGDALDGATVANGGTGTARTLVEAVGIADGSLQANGGNGGNVFNGTGEAGAGGVASASVRSYGTTNALTDVQLYSGNGGTASGVGATGGRGAAVGAYEAFASGYDIVNVQLIAQAGSGGDGFGGANGGRGADVTLIDAVQGIAHGGDLSLIQAAYAGNGGGSEGGVAADGSDAVSTLHYDAAATEIADASVTLLAYAAGGSGGSQFGAVGVPGVGGNGGDGIATLFASSDAETVLNAESIAWSGAAGNATTVGLGGNAIAQTVASGVEVHASASAVVLTQGGTSGLGSAYVSADGSSGEAVAAVTLRPALFGGGATAIGTISSTLIGEANTVAVVGGAGKIAAGTPADSAMVIATDLPPAVLASLYAGETEVETAFTADTAEGIAYGGLSLVHAGGAGPQTVSGTLQVQLSTSSLLDGLGDATVGLLDGDALGGGFESLRFEVFAGSADFVTLFDREFGREVNAEEFFDDNAFDLGDLSPYSEFGNVILNIRITAVLAEEGDGFSADFLFADIGGSGGGDEPIGPFFGTQEVLPPLPADLMLA